MYRRSTRFVIIFTVLLLLGACANSSLHSAPRPTLNPASPWTVLPFTNNTTTPYAGARAQYLTVGLLGSLGANTGELPPPATQASPLALTQNAQSITAGIAWARTQRIRYALTGSVDEWRYKIGLSGVPAVGLTLRLIDVPSGKTLWTATGSATGESDEGLAVLAQRTLEKLLRRLIH